MPDIGPRIGIDGYAAYRKNMNNIIQQSKTLAAEMKAVTSAYDDNDKSQEKLTQQAEVLNKQIQVQQKRIAALKGAVEDSAKIYGESANQTLKFQEELSKATVALNRMQQELDGIQGELDGTDSGMDDLADSIEDAGDAAEQGGDGFTTMKGIIADLASNAIQAGISAVSDFAGEILGLSEATREYREMQAKLQGSAESFGYSVEFAKDQYSEFYRYLADDQATTNAVTNLMGLQTSTQSLQELTEASIAVWSAYGDSIPIESLTESINETAQVAQVTGVLADALNWAGISEDDFNEKLQNLTTTQKRADLIADTLNDTYGASKAAYDEMTGGIQDANEAELELKETQAELGETLEPVNTAITKLKNKALKGVEPLVEAVADAFEFLEGNVNDARQEIYDAIDSVDEAKKALKETSESIEDSNKNLKDAMEEMENGESSAQVLIDALEDLEEKSGKTADEQYRMEAVITELNKMFPDLGLAIDDSTGKLNKSIDSISDYVSQSENMELAAQAQTNAAAATDTLAAAEAARAETMEQASAVTAQILALESEMSAMLDAQTQKETARAEAQQAYNEALSTGVGDTTELYNAMMDTSEAMVEYQGQMMTVSDAYALANSDLTMLKEAEAGYREQLQAQDDKLAELKGTLDQYNTSITGSAGAMGTAGEASGAYREEMALNQQTAQLAMEAFSGMAGSLTGMTTSLVDGIGNIATEFLEMKNNLSDTITSQMDMFSAFDASVDLSTSDLLANLRSQVEGVEEWEKNISTLGDTAINKNLLQYLINMGPSGAGYVQLFASMTEEELAEANTLWEDAIDIQNLTNTWGQELLETGTELMGENIDSLSEFILGKSKTTGEELPAGLGEGIKSNADAATSAADEVAQDTIDQINQTAGVNSPSRYTKQTGEYLDDGLKAGIESGKSQVLQAAKRLSTELIRSLNTSLGTTGGTSTKTKPMGQSAAKGVASGLTSNVQSVRSACRRVANSALSSMRSSLSASSFRGMGSNASSALASGILSGRSAVISAASSVAASAISAAQSQLQIHSPSRVFWDMGENSADAYASGMEARKKALIESVAGTLDMNMKNAIQANAAYGDYGAVADAIRSGMNGIQAGTTMGNVAINVYAAEGQSAREIADTVMERLQHLVEQREAVFG